MSREIPVFSGGADAQQARPRVTRTTARPISAMQRRPAPDGSGGGRSWFVGSSSRPSSAGLVRGAQPGRIRPASALARMGHGAPAPGTTTSFDDDMDDSFSVASTRQAGRKPSGSRPGSPATYKSGWQSRPVSAMSRPISATSRASDVDTLPEDVIESPDAWNDEEVEPIAMRRYFTKDLDAPDGKGKLAHFCVRMPASEMAGADGLAGENKRSHLRIYYSDLLNAKPAEPPVGPNERTIEVEKMAAWLIEVAPRSRVDAFPLLVLTRDILRRFVSKDLTLVNTHSKRVESSLELTNKALKKTQQDLAKSVKQTAARDEKIKGLQALADKLPSLELELKTAHSLCDTYEGKIAELHKKAEEQKEAARLKLEETKIHIKEKTEAANAKAVELLKAQIEGLQGKLEVAHSEHKSTKNKLSESEKKILREKDTWMNRLKDESARVVSVEEKAEQLKVDLNQAQTHAQQVNSAKEKLEAQILQLQTQLDSALDRPEPEVAAPESNKAEELQAELEQAHACIRDLTSEKEKLEARLTGLQAELEEALKRPEPEAVVEPAAPAAVEPKELPKVPDEDFTKVKRCRSQAVFKIDPKALKGKTPNAMQPDKMLSMFASIYESKAHADMVDDREGNKRQSFPEFLRDWMIHKFGLKSIALSNLASVILGVQSKRQDKDVGLRIEVFGYLSGIIPHECWHEDLSNMILMALGLLFQIEKISENMGHGAAKKPLVEAVLCIEATQQAWAAYGFGQVPANLEDAMVQMSRREGGQMRLHEWLQLLTNAWLSAAESMEKDLLLIFKQHDTNGDNVLDLDEFRGLVTSLLAGGHVSDLKVGEEGIDERQISRLFAEALEESSAMQGTEDEADEDVMKPAAFVRVARRARLYAPAH